MLVGMYLKSANYDGALDFWKKAHDKAPTDPFPVAQIADTLEQAARYQESRDWYVKLAAMETKADAQADAWYRVGVSYQREIKRLGPGGSPEQRVKLADSGLAALEKASALAPDNTNYLTYAGILYRQRGFAQGKSYFGVVDAVTGSVYTKKVADIRAKKAAQAPTGLPGQTPTQAPAPAGNQKQ
jgi:tetratricopeptide (TPR) repeat protein